MSENQFFERKGPFPLSEIIKVIGCSGNFSPENNFKIRSFESLDNASNNDMTFLNSGKYQDLSLKTKAAACITTTNLSKFLPEKCIKLDVKNVLFAVTKVAKMFYPKADIDFPDENLPKNIINAIRKTSNNILIEIKKTLNDQKVGERIREGFRIAIVGPTNSGKSSLLNYLSKRDVAIVSEIAGTTRDVIETHLNLDGYPVVVSDTAGIRDSKNEIEKMGIKIALNRAEDADLKLVIVSAKNVNFTGVLKGLLTKNAVLVVNKSDLMKGKFNSKFKKYEHVLISIKKDSNLNKLISKIKNKLKNKFTTAEDILITRERHRQNLINCVHHLEKFEKKKSAQDFDKAAEDLRLATRHLGMIVGKVDVEELLGSIFNDFCIGK